MALSERTRASRPSRALSIYLGVLGLAFLIIAGASIIWRSTDNSGTNMLATDPQATSPPRASTSTSGAERRASPHIIFMAVKLPVAMVTAHRSHLVAKM